MGNKAIWSIIGVVFGLLVLFDMLRPAKSEEYINVQFTLGVQLDMPWYIEGHWEGDVPAEISVAYYNVNDKGVYFTAGYSHQSNLLSGPPFDDRFENVLDQVYIGVGKKFTLK